ncbi:ABC transporter ATP-binding protein [Alloalcanivorax mobilis]|uniref:ABC transporter ATP-binding protein n=1 Tax=Alloalcanivorax mobilis TaxID=2019569 RepID=UPI000B5B429C|nr:ABC transporter ATP-binding protein [Alloalcanivorax mobilis]ASK35367.1 ABC transporter ATP-binding protein [Alcanivorax sp. N3-2A]|tara:strand:+ start:12792 stop:13538 length:747 start_codon:yes stop_codon:yes gene_type:complete
MTSAAPFNALPDTPNLLELSGITTAYGRIEVLHGLELRIGAGETVALVGANGAGKSTLLRVISGLQPASGALRFDGADLARTDAAERVRRGIVQVPEGRQVFTGLSVEDNLLLGAYTRRDKKAIQQDLEKQYQRFPILKDKRRLPAGTLSGGQQQMLAMGRALMARPRLLLLDEPSMGLAPLIIEQIFAIVGELKQEGITLFVVEQNAAEALAVADRGYVLETGSIVAEGHGQALLDNDSVKAAYLGG